MWMIVGVVAGGYVLICLLAFLFQDRLVFIPGRTLGATPSVLGLVYEDVRFPASDGVELHGWFVPAGADGPGGGAPVVLVCHGNAGTIADRLDTIAILHDLGASVFIFDYRGYGESAGSPSEEGTYRDARAAWDHLVEARDVAPAHIVILGRSLGGAVAVELCTHVTPAGLILESTFTTMGDLGARVYPLLPVKLLSRSRYDSRARIAGIRVPKLFLHSPHDDVVPHDLGRALFDAAPEPKEWVEMAGAHNDGFLVTGTRYREAIGGFIRSVTGDRMGLPPRGGVRAPPGARSSSPSPRSSPCSSPPPGPRWTRR